MAAIDTLTIVGFVAGSAILTRQIVQELKEKNWLRSGIITLLASIAINTLLALCWAFYEGYEINVTVVAAVFQVIVSTYYQEYKKSQEVPAAQVVIPVSVQKD